MSERDKFLWVLLAVLLGWSIGYYVARIYCLTASPREARSKRSLSRRLRSIGIEWSLGLSCWVTKMVIMPAKDDSLRLKIGFFVDGLMTQAFAWCYEGSDEEESDGIEFALDDVPMKYLTPRQREIKLRLCEWVDVETAE